MPLRIAEGTSDSGRLAACRALRRSARLSREIDGEELHRGRHRRRERDRHLQLPALAARASTARGARSRRSRSPWPAVHAPTFERQIARCPGGAVRSIDRGRDSPRRSGRRARRPIGRSAVTPRRARSTSAGDGCGTRGCRPPVFDSSLQRALGHAAPARVGQIPEGDDSHAVLRQPAHQRSETREARRCGRRRDRSCRSRRCRARIRSRRR